MMKLTIYHEKQKVHFVLFSEPMGSMSSMEVNVDALEQMDLMDISDQEALDVFLNSGGGDNIVMSPGMGKSRDNTISPASSMNPFLICRRVVRYTNTGCLNLCTLLPPGSCSQVPEAAGTELGLPPV